MSYPDARRDKPEPLELEPAEVVLSPCSGRPASPKLRSGFLHSPTGERGPLSAFTQAAALSSGSRTPSDLALSPDHPASAGFPDNDSCILSRVSSVQKVISPRDGGLSAATLPLAATATESWRRTDTDSRCTPQTILTRDEELKTIVCDETLSYQITVGDEFRVVTVVEEGETQTYTVVGCVGEGMRGKVYKVHDLECNIFAMKVIPRKAYAKAEVRNLRRILHPNVIRVHRVVDNERCPDVFLITDFVSGGPLCQLTETGYLDGERWSEDRAKGVFCCMVEVIKHLHLREIVHRDIKPDNCLLTADGRIVFIDFGESYKPKKGDDAIRCSVGAPFFRPPEAGTGDNFSAKAQDTWALGVTLHLLLGGKVPFGAGCTSVLTLQTRLEEDTLDLSDTDLSPEARDLLHGLLHKDPALRMDVNAAHNHRWVTGCEFPVPLRRTPSLAPTPRLVMTSPGVNGPAAASSCTAVSGAPQSFFSALDDDVSFGDRVLSPGAPGPEPAQPMSPLLIPASITVFTPCSTPLPSPQLTFLRRHTEMPTPGKASKVRRAHSVPRRETSSQDRRPPASPCRQTNPQWCPACSACPVEAGSPSSESLRCVLELEMATSVADPDGSSDDAARPYKILIVDDAFQYRDLVARMVHFMIDPSDRVYDIEVCEEGEKAYAERIVAKDGELKLIIMAIHLPTMSGLEAAQTIREWEQKNDEIQTPIVAMTSDRQHPRMAECVQDAGFSMLLPKPIVPAQLRYVLKWAKVPVKDHSDVDMDLIFSKTGNSFDKSCRRHAEQAERTGVPVQEVAGAPTPYSSPRITCGSPSSSAPRQDSFSGVPSFCAERPVPLNPRWFGIDARSPDPSPATADSRTPGRPPPHQPPASPAPFTHSGPFPPQLPPLQPVSDSYHPQPASTLSTTAARSKPGAGPLLKYLKAYQERNPGCDETD
eukprot:TRINITY_DN15784_c0_g1_i1.p1 TRINITY_DN15784_c0_g1~~TRINITY_DN15784_c0_g1_i1.p1  ORF type:complete len:934 (+),score=86.47 TRINITY_DN15784_c0_g1_i1:70-2871(+)